MTINTWRTSVAGIADDEASSTRSAISDALRASIFRCTMAGLVGCLIFALVGWRVTRTIRRYAACVETVTSEVSAARDVADAALRESEALRYTVDQHSLVSVVDPQGRIVDVNEAYCRISGYSRAELLGRNHRVVDSGYHSARFWKEVWGTLVAGRPWRGEVCNMAKDGSVRWFDSVIAPFKGADGSIEKYVSISTDITERKRMAESLRESAERFQIVCRATTDAVWDMDLFTNAIWWNDGFGTLFGYAPQEIEPGVESWTSRIHRDDQQRVADGIHAVIAGTGHAWSDEYRFRCRNGEYSDIFDRGVVMRDALGTAVRMTGAMQDITVRKRAEQNLIVARSAAETASRAKSEFLANMSHEIRTPLTAIMGFADIMREDGASVASPEQRASTLDTIKSAGQHLLTVINDILDLSKIEANRMSIEKIETPLADMLGEIDSLMRPRHHEAVVGCERDR